MGRRTYRLYFSLLLGTGILLVVGGGVGFCAGSLTSSEVGTPHRPPVSKTPTPSVEIPRRTPEAGPPPEMAIRRAPVDLAEAFDPAAASPGGPLTFADYPADLRDEEILQSKSWIEDWVYEVAEKQGLRIAYRDINCAAPPCVVTVDLLRGEGETSSVDGASENAIFELAHLQAAMGRKFGGEWRGSLFGTPVGGGVGLLWAQPFDSERQTELYSHAELAGQERAFSLARGDLKLILRGEGVPPAQLDAELARRYGL